MSFIVTGGAGYLGSHLVDLLIQFYEEEVIVIDDLSNGVYERLPAKAVLVNSALDDARLSERIGKFHGIKGVFHLAAKKSVSESILQPKLYRRNNVDGTANIMQLCKNLEIKNLVFTSSAAVYGSSQHQISITETSPCNPQNPYGESKLFAEKLIQEFSQNDGFQCINLRVFNMAGSVKSAYFDRKGENVIPVILRSIEENKSFSVFGSNLSTPDGTCVRDYIHVNDVARAHLMAMQKMLDGVESLPLNLNISSGRGTSVMELIQSLEIITSRKISIEFQEPRKGDPDVVIGNCNKARETLGWEPQKEVKEMLSESWISW